MALSLWPGVAAFYSITLFTNDRGASEMAGNRLWCQKGQRLEKKKKKKKKKPKNFLLLVHSRFSVTLSAILHDRLVTPVQNHHVNFKPFHSLEMGLRDLFIRTKSEIWRILVLHWISCLIFFGAGDFHQFICWFEFSHFLNDMWRNHSYITCLSNFRNRFNLGRIRRLSRSKLSPNLGIRHSH